MGIDGVIESSVNINNRTMENLRKELIDFVNYERGLKAQPHSPELHVDLYLNDKSMNGRNEPTREPLHENKEVKVCPQCDGTGYQQPALSSEIMVCGCKKP